MNSATGPQFPIGRVFDRGSDAVFSFLAGTCLAVLQLSHFFLLEAFLSSTAFSYFAAVLFWLVGFVVGLNQRVSTRFPLILLLGVATYYCALWTARTFPYQVAVLPVMVVCVAASGIAAGAFFPCVTGRFHKVKHLFFHENNGFIAGILLSLVGSVWAGQALLFLGPAAGMVAVLATIQFQRKRSSETAAIRASDMAAGCHATRISSATPLLISGLYFGVLQVAIYFTIQAFVTASFVGYFLVVLAWLLGVIVSLKMPLPRSLGASMLISLGAYQGLVLLAPLAGTNDLLLGVAGLLVALCALPAGTLFRVMGPRVPGRSLFFHENNGFVVGYAVAVFGFVCAGQNFLQWGPVLCFCAAWLAQNRLSAVSLLILGASALLGMQLGSPGLFWSLTGVTALAFACLFVRPRRSGVSSKATAEVARDIPARLLKPLLVLAGINLILLQYVITREFSTILAASELTILIVACAYFAGFSVGYGACRFVGMRMLRIGVTLLFAAHMALLPFVKVLAGSLISSGFGMQAMLLLVFMTAFFTSAFYSILLPKFVERMGSRSLATAYAWDLGGAALATVAIFLLIPAAPGIILPVYFLVLLMIVVLVLWRTGWSLPVGITGAAVIALFCAIQGDLTTITTEDYYESRNYKNPKLLFSGSSFYHSVDVIDTFKNSEQTRPLSRVSFINGVRYFSYERDPSGKLSGASGLSEFSYFLAEVPARYLSQQLNRKLRILVLGCGSMYSLSRVDEWSEKTTIVEIDPLVVESARACWSDLNRHDQIDTYEIVIDDAAHYLRTTSESFDLIINDISAPYYLGTALLHGREFFELARSRLKPRGILSESTQGRPRSDRSDGQGMKILKGIAEAFPRYRMVEARGRPHQRKSGYVYASQAFVFSTADLKLQLKQDGTLAGTRFHAPGCDHFDLTRTAPYSLDSMGPLLVGNLNRMRGRLKLDRNTDHPRMTGQRRAAGHALAGLVNQPSMMLFGVAVLVAAFLSRLLTGGFLARRRSG